MAEQIRQPKLSRATLAKFLPDIAAVRVFERLLLVGESLTPDDIQLIYGLIGDLDITLGSASSRAVEALDSVERLRGLLEQQQINLPPALALPQAFGVDYLDFAQAAPFLGQQGRVGWNADDDTLDIGHGGGVVQQVGLELFGRVVNGTAAAFANGAVLGINQSTGAYVPFIANGTMPSLNAVGLASETVAPGAKGRVTVWGMVNGIDTTGAAGSEAWAVGDMLYVSPTVAGRLTKVKPTAPNLSIPMGRVTIVSATAGQIAVRPIPEQQKYYGQFTKGEDQVPAAANTAYPITWSSTASAIGVSLGTPASRIVVANAGLYRFNASVQLTSSSSTVKNVWLWYRKNGVDIPNSALITSLDSGTAIRAPSRSMLTSMVAGDYIELMFASDSTAITVDAVPATTFAPAAPAALMSVSQEQQ